MKKLIIDIMNRFDSLQHVAVHLVLDAPAWMGEIAHSMLEHCKPGIEYLEDRQISLGYHRYMRMQEAARILRMHGHAAKIEHDPPRIWIGEETIDCVWDVMNALVVKKSVFEFILVRNES